MDNQRIEPGNQYRESHHESDLKNQGTEQSAYTNKLDLSYPISYAHSDLYMSLPKKDLIAKLMPRMMGEAIRIARLNQSNEVNLKEKNRSPRKSKKKGRFVWLS